jgi:hypothetical protein
MTCETCDHTTSGLGNGYFWCPRCGTLKRFPQASWQTVTTPKLVERCREFGRTLGPLERVPWYRLGIEESIYRPEERQAP